MSIQSKLLSRFPHKTQKHWWQIPFLARGGVGSHGWWFKVLGLRVTYNECSHFGYANETSTSLFGLVGVIFQNDRGHLKLCGKRWAFRHIRLNLKAAVRWVQ